MDHPALQDAPTRQACSDDVVTPSGRRISRTTQPPAEVRTYESVKQRVSLRDIVASFDVTRTLASQAFKVRYKQSALGPIWLAAQPAALLGLVTLIFTSVVKVSIPHNIGYATFALVGMTVWAFFQLALNTGASAFVANAGLVRYSPAPRIAFVLSVLVVALLPFALMLPATFITSGLDPGLGVRTLVMPFLLCWVVVFTGSVVLMLATLTARFRDLVALIPFGLQIGLLATPIAYPFSLGGHTVQVLLALNPLSGIIEAWRWAMLGLSPNGLAMGVSGVATLAIAVWAWRIFARQEVLLADRI